MPTASPAPQHWSAASSSSTGSAPRSAARARTACTPTPAPTTSSVKTVRELLRRHPELPPERIDEVAIAATTQQGDQGLTLGRTVGVLAGLPRSVPGYAIDRMCAGAMTAVTNTAAAIGFGAQDVALAGGVEHMGHHPMGFDADPNPRFLSERLVANDALNMGVTAENLHDKFPALTRERADAYGVAQPGQVRRGAGRRQDRPRPGPRRAARPGERLGPGHRRRAARAPAPPSRRSRSCPRRSAPGGRVTAGTAAPLTDGAASCLLAAEETAAELGLPTRMRLVSFAYAGVEPEIMGIGPVPATVKALERAGLTIEDIGLFEINEAFAVQVLSFLDALRHRRRRPARQPVRRRDRRGPPAGLVGRAPDDAARPPVRASTPRSATA